MLKITLYFKSLINNQLIKFKLRKKKKKTQALVKCPQKKEHCEYFFIKAPKKPNSAKRKCVRVRLSTEQKIHCYLPGEDFLLQKYSELFIRGGRKKDLPSIYYTVIKSKFVFVSSEKATARSKYGVCRFKTEFKK